MHFLCPQEEAGHLQWQPLFTFLLILLPAPTKSGVDVLSFQTINHFIFKFYFLLLVISRMLFLKLWLCFLTWMPFGLPQLLKRT